MIRYFNNRPLLNEALNPGDVIKFKMPLFDSPNGKISSISIKDCPPHYAVVIGRTGKIRDDIFNGYDAIKMTHSSEPNDYAPYLSRYSFKPNKCDLNEVKQKFHRNRLSATTKPYSIPNTETKEWAICSIHNNANLPKYKWVGSLKYNVFGKFIKYYKEHKNKMNHLLIDKDGNPFLVIDPYLRNSGTTKYLMDAHGNLVDRSSIKESMEQQSSYILLLLPLDIFINYEDDNNYTDNVFYEKVPWIVRSVIPQTDYTLLLQFKDGKRGVYDMWPLIQQEDGGDDTFVPLEDMDLFMQAYLDAETVGWPGDISIAAKELYDYCMSVPEYERWSTEYQED